MEFRGHKPVLRGTRYVCANCGDFLLDVRTSARLRAMTDVDQVKRDAIERRSLRDPKLAKRLVDEDLREVVATYKLADKFNDFLMNPQARPDLQTPEAQQFLQTLSGSEGVGRESYLNDKTDEMMPWIVREWKKGRMRTSPNRSDALEYQAGPEYDYEDANGKPTNWHILRPNELGHWADWYRSDHPSRKGVDIMQKKAPELHQTIRDWDADMRTKAQDAAQVRGDVEHTYPDGWTVQNINSEKALRDEGNAMGHCVGGYWPHVQSGRTIIHSLRDPHNEPHATWEITPQWYEGPEGDLKSPHEVRDAKTPAQNARWAYDYKPTARQGEIVQIQGKANERPLPEYQQRIKDYFENKFPDEEDRPQWDDPYYEDLDEIDEGAAYGYHKGDYGLRDPEINYDWNALLNNTEYYGQGAYRLVEAAVDSGEFPEFGNEADAWIADKREEHRTDFDPTEWGHAQEEWEQNYEEYTSARPDETEYMEKNEAGEEEFDEAAYYEAVDEWEKKKNQALQESEGEIERDVWDSSEIGEFCTELESELSATRYRIRHEQDQNQHKAATRSAHPRFITGEPCYCTFTKHLEGQPNWYTATTMVCEACGDPLEHGKCKRCDWGQWSNAMGTENPSDPTQDLKPGITNGV